MTPQQIIDKRKELWNKYHNIEKDQEFTLAVANYIVSEKGKELREAINNNPEVLIEMVFVVVDKKLNTVPFFLNDVQWEFIDDLNKAILEFKQGKRLSLKFLVLKGRQQGFTSVITAYQTTCSVTKRNFSGFTIADCSDNTHTIFEDKAKFPYNHLPEPLKPTEKYNNRKELHFEKINSRWRIATASKDIGRSKTINFLHGSEAAFWEVLISDVQAAIGEALTKDAIQIYETTANGYNEYKDLWDSGKWDNKFYEWWRTPEYRTNFESTTKEQQFKNDVDNKATWIYKRCKWLKDVIKLDWQQIYWYFNKWDNYIEKDKIKQEYPCSPDEAFLASGRCVFDKEAIIHRKEYLKKLYETNPPKRGYFIFQWNNAETKDKIKDNTIKFIEDPNGCIYIYEDKQDRFPYVIGGDTKGDGSDFFAGTAINNVTGARVAILHADLDPDIYTHQMYCLGKYYNYALIAIEVNFDTYPIKELQRLGYYRQYRREVIDKISKERQHKFGFKTDGNSRPLIISNEIILIRDNIDLFNHIGMLDECLTFVYDEDNRPDAESSKHDDILFSDMIANHARTQHTISLAQLADVKLPKDLPPDLRRDLMNDPKALEHWLSTH